VYMSADTLDFMNSGEQIPAELTEEEEAQENTEWGLNSSEG
jgi:hypothetical protein